jgi:hypothetical protein
MNDNDIPDQTPAAPPAAAALPPELDEGGDDGDDEGGDEESAPTAGGSPAPGAAPLPCSGDYGVEIALGRSSPNAPPAQCGCSCGAPAGATCGVASIAYYSDGACGQPCAAPEPFATSACVDARPAIGRCMPRDVRSVRIVGGSAVGGSCSPESSVVLPPG